MTRILDRKHPVVGLVQRSLDLLKEKGDLKEYKLKERKSSVRTIEDLYFGIIFTNNKLYGEIKMFEHSDTTFVKSKSRANQICLNYWTESPLSVENLALTILEHSVKMRDTTLSEGFKAEDIYECVLAKMKSSHLIQNYYRPTKQEDGVGIDFYIISQGAQIPIQVKKTLGGLEKHMTRYPFIPLISICSKPESKLTIQTLLICKKYIAREVICL